jgi:hypothetical protein
MYDSFYIHYDLFMKQKEPDPDHNQKLFEGPDS